MVNGKNKGSNWERKFAKQLSLWWSNGESDNIFWRSASSGAFATIRNKKGKTSDGSYGDISAINEIGYALINFATFELKTGYNDMCLLSEIDSDAKKLSFRNALNQVVNDSNLAGNNPFLVINRDRKQPCIFFEKKIFNDMKNYCGELKNDVKYLELWDGDFKWIGFRLEDFFNWANPEYFKGK